MFKLGSCQFLEGLIVSCQGSGRMDETTKSIMAAQMPSVRHQATKPRFHFHGEVRRFVLTTMLNMLNSLEYVRSVQ